MTIDFSDLADARITPLAEVEDKPFTFVSVKDDVRVKVTDIEDGQTKLLVNWRFRIRLDDGSTHTILVQQNAARDAQFEAVRDAMRAGNEVTARITRAQMKQARGGNNWTWTLAGAQG